MSLAQLKRSLQKHWQKDRWFIAALVVITAVAAFLRLYKLEEFITFLGDQGRDTIVIKRILTLEDFPGIGPRSSIGQLFLGPFYFYFMAPFLLLFNFNPVGLGFGVAFLSLLALGFFMWKLRHTVNLPTALLFGALVTFSYVNIWLTRFSWNPNLLPVFAFFAIYFLGRFVQKPTIRSGIFFGFFLAGSLQLHYLTLLILPVLFGYVVYGIWLHRKKTKELIYSLLAAATSFIITFFPFIVFDIKNDFLNIRGLFGLFTEDQFQSKTTYYDKLNGVLNNFLQHVFQVPIQGRTGFLLLAVLLFLVVIGWRYRAKFNQYIYMHVLVLVSFIFMFAIVDSERYQHYFTPVYYSFFAVLAYLITLIRPRLLMAGISIVFVLLYVNLNYPKYWFLQGQGNFQARIAASVADSIISMNIAEPYHIVSIPLTSTNDHIRYFLELKKKTPLPAESLERAENLVILCYEKGKDSCKVYDDPQYQIVIFGDRKVEKEIQHPEDVRIFKIIHAK